MYALKNLKRRQSRSSLTIVGISLAISLTVIMFSIGEGMRGSTKRILEETGIDLFITPQGSTLFLFGLTTITMKNGREITKNLINENYTNSENSKQIRAVYLILNSPLYATKNPNETDIKKIKIASLSVYGVIPKMADRSDIKIYNIIGGEDFSVRNDPFYNNGKYGNETNENFTSEIIINDSTADFLQVKVGETLYLSADIEMRKPINFIVKGIYKTTFESPISLTANIHLSELQFIVGKEKNDAFSTILVDLYDKNSANNIKQWIEKEYFETKEVVTVFTQEDLFLQFNEFVKIFEGFSQMITIVTTIVTIMFTGTVMILSVRERTQEIGLLRAIGLSKKSIFELILIESIFICLIGFILGLIIGYFGSIALDNLLISANTQAPRGMHFVVITPIVILQTTLLTILIGIFSGLIPAYRAVSLNITRILKEG